jgi:hypothetical protein
MWFRYLTLLACIGAGIAIFTTSSESPAPAFLAHVAATDAPERVRIEHDFVRIPITTRETRPVVHASVRRSPSPAPMVRQSAPPPDAGRDRGNLLERTVKTIAGDGRYKPQPFPKPR